jgi:hypothetical protein
MKKFFVLLEYSDNGMIYRGSYSTQEKATKAWDKFMEEFPDTDLTFIEETLDNEKMLGLEDNENE